MLKKFVCFVVAITCCFSILPQFAFAAETPQDIPEGAIVIYADSEEDAQRQMQEYEKWTIESVTIEEMPATTRASLTGLHFRVLVVNHLVGKIYLDYYYDTRNDLPVNVYNAFVSFEEFIGTNYSVNNVYARVINSTTIQTDMDIHYEYYIFVEGIGKVYARNRQYRVMHNVANGKVELSEV